MIDYSVFTDQELQEELEWAKGCVDEWNPDTQVAEFEASCAIYCEIEDEIKRRELTKPTQN